MDRLSQALHNIEQATAQAARSADETAAESEELGRTSSDLNEAVQSLHTLVG